MCPGGRECQHRTDTAAEWLFHQVMEYMIPQPDQEAASNSPSHAHRAVG
jgi:hypothetical protein